MSDPQPEPQKPQSENTGEEIVIVGGGAAGLTTAIFARRLGCRHVRVLDGAARPGAKILVSGGSRCNVTNAVVTERDYWGGRLRATGRALSHALTAFPVRVRDRRGYNYAEATAGGVALDEIDPATMQSRKRPGLFLVGEMLDVDGRLGGFNFQWAWSSARAAAEGLLRRASTLALAAAVVLAAACGRPTGTPIRVIDLLEEVDHAELRPAGGAFSVVQHTCGGEARPGLSVPPVSRVTWQTVLPKRGRLETGAALTGGADGSASFRIGISDDRMYEALLVRSVAAAECSERWVPMTVDLSRYAGRKLSLFYRPGKTAWRVIFSVTQEAGAPVQALWAVPAIDADRESARAFFERKRE